MSAITKFEKFSTHKSSTTKIINKQFLSNANFVCIYSPLKPLSEEVEHSKYLHQSEIDHYHSLKFELKKHQYLLGRLAAKKALEPLFESQQLSDIAIDNGVFGQPIVKSKQFCPYQISISHRDNIAVAIAFEEACPMAIDIEVDDPKRYELIKDYLSEKEIALLRQVSAKRDIYHILAWSVKEAYGKVMKFGMTIPLNLLEISAIKTVKSNIFGTDNIWVSFCSNFPQYKVISWELMLDGNSFIISISIPKSVFISF